jgi:hypothetical protein
MAPSSVPGQDTPKQLSPFGGATDRRAAPALPPLPPDRRVGFALVSLGRLSPEAILPALPATKLCRLAA